MHKEAVMWLGWKTLSLECWREGAEGGRARRMEPAVAATGTNSPVGAPRARGESYAEGLGRM